jgi:hypothetical protein
MMDGTAKALCMPYARPIEGIMVRKNGFEKLVVRRSALRRPIFEAFRGDELSF